MTYLDFTNKDFYIVAKNLLLSKGKRVELVKFGYLCRPGENDNRVGFLASASI